MEVIEQRVWIAKNNLNFLWEVILRTNKEEKFKILSKRRIVESVFSWFESYRSLSKDFEFKTKTSEAIVQLAMLKLMLNSLRIKRDISI
jgi:putative transposase